MTKTALTQHRASSAQVGAPRIVKPAAADPGLAAVSGIAELDPVAPRRTTLDDTVYEHIKGMILAHQLRPGHKLAPQHLADQLHVSRTPIRQALERLYQEGYAIRIADRGYYVAEIDARETRNLYQSRLALEPFLMRAAMERGISRDDQARLEELQETYQLHVTNRAAIERVLADQAFHLHLASLADNEYLLGTLRSVFERLNLKRRIDGYWPDTGKRGHAGAREHREMLRAIRANRVADAVAIMQAHIEQAWAQYEGHLLKIQPA